MTFVILLLLAGFILQLVFIHYVTKEQYVPATIFKVLASSSFVIAGLIEQSGSIIVVGQLCGAFGDAFLEARHLVATRNKVFIIGIMFFAMEHIILIAASFELAVPNVLSSVIMGIFLYGVLILITRSCFKNADKEIKPYGIVYMLILATMVCFSVNTAIALPTARTLIFTLASILFVTSDTILVHVIAGKNYKWMHPTSLIVYYLAQSMFVISMIL